MVILWHTHNSHFPFDAVKAGVAVFDTLPFAGFLQLFFFIGLAELGFSTVEKDIQVSVLFLLFEESSLHVFVLISSLIHHMQEFCMKEAKRVGWSDEKMRNKMAIELNNGRAAQMGIFGLVVHEKIDNNPYILNSLLGAPVDFNNLPVASY